MKVDLRALSLPLLPGILAGYALAADLRRDWQQSPAIVQIQTSQDIYAIGDVHGDRERLERLMNAAGLVRQSKWCAGRATLVFTGDMIDKGPDSLGVIKLVRALKKDAAQAGGRVVALMGNHEAEFLASPQSSKSSEFAGELQHAGMSSQTEALEFLHRLSFATKINDWFFSHAGNSAGRSVEQLSSDLERSVDAFGFGAEELLNENSLLTARLGDKGPGGKSWIDSQSRKMSADRLLANYAGALGVKHIVEGHHHGPVRFEDGEKRKTGEMYQWHGKLFLIDTGLSREIDDSGGAVLHIALARPASATAICADGKSTLLWDERNPTKSGSAEPCAK